MKYSLFVLLLLPLCLFGQYPTTGVKQRLGYQTTGDGLVYRGNGSPSYTPSGINSAWAYIDTTAGTIYTYYAGSWHLVSAGGGGSFDGHVDSLVFNTDVTVVDSVGKMYYDAANETISVGIDGGAVYQLGQELYYPLVINKSGATIHNGQPVMVDTATLVTGDHVRVIPARNGAAYPSDYVMGVATTDIPNDSTGVVTWFGYVREVKESDIAQTGVTIDAGEILYISSTEPGKYTDTPPTSPAHKSTIALVVRKPSVNNITLLVRPWLAPKLDNLSNVNTSSVTGLSVLRYNSTTGTWDASATAGIVAADTAAMLSYYQKKLTNPVTGTGAAGQVAYWNGTGTQTGSSFLTIDISKKNLNFENGNILLNGGIASLTGTNNVIIGQSAGYQLTNGIDNVLIGRQAGGAVRTSRNIYIGYLTGENQYQGGDNIAIGYNSSRKFTSTNTYNVVIGTNAGTNSSDIYSSGSNNIIVGSLSGQLSTGSNNTIIGHNIDLSGSANNRLTIKNLIFGLDASGTGTTAAGKLGVLQPTPSYTLDINATDAIRIPSGTTAQQPTGAAGVLRFNSDSTALEYHNGTSWRGIVNTWDASTGGGGGSSVWSTTADTVYLPAGKYVGIGTASPDQVLQVNGNALTKGLRVNTSGLDELDINNYAGAGSTGGNIYIGNGGQSGTSAYGNIGIGNNSLLNVTTGLYNLSVGADAMKDVTTGFSNVAVGGSVLARLTTGRNNIAFGANIAVASVNPFTGNYNLFLGGGVAQRMETGSYNCFIGQSSGNKMISGEGNLLIGTFTGSGTSSTTMTNNVGVGAGAMFNQNGSNNLAFGPDAMRESYGASYNTSLGGEAGYYNQGNYNTIVGYQAGKLQNAGTNLTTLAGSVLIGFDARANTSELNTIVIGAQARSQGSNTIMLGNSSITSLYCYDTSISSPSDERDKTDIDSLTIGLEFLKKLNPVAFTWNARDGGKVGQKDVGFIAQQAMPAQAAEAQGLNLNLVEYKESTDQYFMQYSNLIPVLVKAIQEQQAQIDALKIEIENLKNK